jgi:hypothetical protein
MGDKLVDVHPGMNAGASRLFWGGGSTVRDLRRVQRPLRSRTALAARAARVLLCGPGHAHVGAGGPGARRIRVRRATLRRQA